MSRRVATITLNPAYDLVGFCPEIERGEVNLVRTTGLHARPGTMLVNTIKQFTSDITVTNLDGSGKPANGRSLMKVVALGVKKGHRLRFTAQGDDARQALDAIGEAIASGLGEGA